MLQTIENTADNISITLKEITDLIDVRHHRAMQKVEELTKESSFGTVSKIDIVYNDKNQTIPTYILNKKQAIAVGAKLNDSLLMKLIDKLEELESKKNKPLTYEQTMQNALLLADKRVKALESKIEIDKPKVVFADAISSTETDLLIGDWAKTIGVQAKACRAWLIDKKLMFDANKNKEKGKNSKYRVSAYGISSGYLKQTEIPIMHPNPSFPNRIGITVRITAKGQAHLTDKALIAIRPDIYA